MSPPKRGTGGHAPMLCRAPVCQEIFKHVLEGVPTGEYEQTIKVSIDAALSRTTPGCIAFWLHSLLLVVPRSIAPSPPAVFDCTDKGWGGNRSSAECKPYAGRRWWDHRRALHRTGSPLMIPEPSWPMAHSAHVPTHSAYPRTHAPTRAPMLMPLFRS